MFKNEKDIFEQWIEEEVSKVLEKLQKKETSLSLEDKIILTLKAQTNHFYHLDTELREEIKKNNDKIDLLDVQLREEIKKNNDKIDLLDVQLREEIKKNNDKIDLLDKKLHNEIEILNKKFDNQIEILNKKFDNLQSSIIDLYKLISAQSWKVLGAVGLIIVLGKLIDKIPF